MWVGGVSGGVSVCEGMGVILYIFLLLPPLHNLIAWIYFATQFRIEFVHMCNMKEKTITEYSQILSWEFWLVAFFPLKSMGIGHSIIISLTQYRNGPGNENIPRAITPQANRAPLVTPSQWTQFHSPSQKFDRDVLAMRSGIQDLECVTTRILRNGKLH